MGAAHFWLAVAVMATGLAFPARAAEQGRVTTIPGEYVGISAAAKTILRDLVTTQAVIERCAEIMKPNDEIYWQIARAEIAKNKSVMDEINRIIPHSTQYPTFQLMVVNKVTEVIELESANPAKFDHTCWLLPGEAAHQLGIFAPLAERYPAEMRLISGWD